MLNSHDVNIKTASRVLGSNITIIFFIVNYDYNKGGEIDEFN